MGITNDYPVFDSIEKCDVEADVVIDFSNAAAVDALLEYCVEKAASGCTVYNGTFQEQLAKVEEAAGRRQS